MTRHVTRHAVLAATILAAGGWISSAQAAFVTITDPTGNSDFTLYYDDSQSGPFGQPQLVNNKIFFVTNDFATTSANGAGPISINDSVSFRIDVIAGRDFSIDGLFLTERGDYLIDGPGASVSAQGQIRAFDAFDPSVDFTDFLVTGPMDNDDGRLHNWIGTAALDGSNGWTATSSAWVTLENLLIADTDFQGDYAFIEKKNGLVEIQVGTVPVPPAFVLFASALVAMMRRRR